MTLDADGLRVSVSAQGARGRGARCRATRNARSSRRALSALHATSTAPTAGRAVTLSDPARCRGGGAAARSVRYNLC